MRETIDQAKTKFLYAKGRIEQSLRTTPDDRVNWSPSPTARTPAQQVAHAAYAVKSLNETLSGRPFAIKTTEEADRFFREWERQFTSREHVSALLEENCAAYLAWLEGLTPECLQSPVELPFSLGTIPAAMGLGFPADHLLWHAAQIDYIQTIYGDLDWYQ